MGLNSASEVFQRSMSLLLLGLDGVICHMDDILIHAITQQEHDVLAQEVLTRLQATGLTLNEKCVFSKKINFISGSHDR